MPGCQAKELKEMMLHPCDGVAVDAVDYNAWQWVMWLEDFEEGSELEQVRTARAVQKYTTSSATARPSSRSSKGHQPQPFQAM